MYKRKCHTFDSPTDVSHEASNKKVEAEKLQGVHSSRSQSGSYLNKMKPMDSTAALLTSSLTSLTLIKISTVVK